MTEVTVADDLRPILELIQSTRSPMVDTTPESLRSTYSALGPPGGAEMAAVEDRTIPGPDGDDLPVRIYRPSADAERRGRNPCRLCRLWLQFFSGSGRARSRR